MPAAILIIEDEAALARNLQTYLERAGYEVRVVDRAERGVELVDTFKPELVLLDYNLPGMDGLSAIGKIRQVDEKMPIVLMTGHGSTELAVNAMKAGASDYLSKPLSLSEVKMIIERLIGQEQLLGTVDYYQRRDATESGLKKILGDSPPMRALKQTIGTLLEAERTMVDGQPPAVLIIGETGTGKELVARALHFDGRRRDKPFVEINCGAMPATLIESELFGYERGAFTDARQRKAGLAETASGGSLFLDEIGETEPSLQTKLLKLLEEQTVRRLGGLREQQVDVRVISATNRPLEAMIAEGKFRADLFYRLRMIQVEVPPLRERGDDIRKLAEHFLEIARQRYRKPGLQLAPESSALLMAHTWPGNVRELRNAVEQAVLMARGEQIEPHDFPLLMARAGVGSAELQLPAAQSSNDHEIDLNLERLERRAIERALERTSGNVTHAARLLGVTRDTLRYRRERLRIRID